MDATDRRRSPRIPVQLRIEWKDLGRPKESYTEISRDISEGGLFVATTVGVEQGSLLELEITPGGGSAPIRVRAEVIRVEEEPARTGSKTTARIRGMALRFIEAEGPEVERLRSLVTSMEGKRSANVESNRTRKR